MNEGVLKALGKNKLLPEKTPLGLLQEWIVNQNNYFTDYLDFCPPEEILKAFGKPQNKIIGVSGASAGAITAFSMCLGDYSQADFNAVIKNVNLYPLTPFETAVVETKIIIENGFPRSKKNNPDGSPLPSRSLKKQLKNGINSLKASNYLLNKQFPVSEDNYKKWKNEFKNTWTSDSNPCIPFLNKIKL